MSKDKDEHGLSFNIFYRSVPISKLHDVRQGFLARGVVLRAECWGVYGEVMMKNESQIVCHSRLYPSLMSD